MRVYRCQILIAAVVAMCTACANGPRSVPYPAFVESDKQQVTFLAALPGVRAKPLSSDIRSNALASVVEIPARWTGTTGGAPGMTAEIFVLAGELRLSEFRLGPGGYAYLPSGGLGFRLASDSGARILYFLDAPQSDALIRSPIILENNNDWHAAVDGVDVIMLRVDSGNGSRTWLRRIQPATDEPWESSSATREGFLVSGEYTTSECVAGDAITASYRPGGYFRRPAGAVSGGPESAAAGEVIWFFREGPGAAISYHERCAAAQ